MFTSAEQQQQRQGKDALGRYEYLQRLVAEYSDTGDRTARRQVLAHLANFSYDPLNYEHLRVLRVVPELFLDVLEEQLVPPDEGEEKVTIDDDLLRSAIAGICNSCSDMDNLELYMEQEAAELVGLVLACADERSVGHAMAALALMLTEATVRDVATPAIVECMEKYRDFSSSKLLRNLSAAFLLDASQLLHARDAISASVSAAIPASVPPPPPPRKAGLSGMGVQHSAPPPPPPPRRRP